MPEIEKLKWAALLEAMVRDYRKNKPASPFTDTDIIRGIMAHFQKTGFVSRRADGKWVCPKLNI